jgi:hypothetical protein
MRLRELIPVTDLDVAQDLGARETMSRRALRTLLFALLIVDSVASASFLWQQHLLHGWQSTNPAVLSGSPDAYYLYSGVLRAESSGLGFVIGFWVGSIAAMGVALRCAPDHAKLMEKSVALGVAIVPPLVVGVSALIDHIAR